MISVTIEEWTADSLANLFKTCDALRKGGRFQELVNICLAIYSEIYSEEKDKLSALGQTAKIKPRLITKH